MKFIGGIIQIQHFSVLLILACILIGIICLNSLISEGRNPIFSLYSSGKKVEKATSWKPTFCDFSDKRSDICDIKGDIRIYGAASSITLINPNIDRDSNSEEKTVRIRPYPRKSYAAVMERITEIRITSRAFPLDFQECVVNHTIPAIIFSNEGFLGNFYHDFDDCLIPLFITSRQFNGEVQFLISNMQPWWVNKYKEVLAGLSNYELTNMQEEKNIHCYPHVIVNLHSHKNISIDPSRAPNNYSLVDFAKFLRKKYTLDRDIVDINTRAKPRLLIIARKKIRRFTNVEEMVSMAEGLGFEVVAQETDPTVVNFSKVMNSFDAMIGVQGAGLTNFMFLPDNAILIQVAPLGKLSPREDYGVPAMDRNLRYLQYDISNEESTLSEIYPKDHPVFTDPSSLFKKGWVEVANIFLFQQNVKINVTRFRPVLVRALELLREK